MHLTVECSRPHDLGAIPVREEHCAAALDSLLQENPGHKNVQLLVTTSRKHHGQFWPVIEVLASHRPDIIHLGLGALAFPDFDRGTEPPEKPGGDGSSWNLSVPLDRVLAAVPSLELLVVQAKEIDICHDILGREPPPPFPEMVRLRRLVLRGTALDPAILSALGASSFPRLESLDLWLGNFEWGWGASARDLIPLLNSPGFRNLRHLTLVSDLREELVDVLADSALVARLESLRLKFGVFGASEALRLRDRWSAFRNLKRLDVTGNTIPGAEALALREMAPSVVKLGEQRIRFDDREPGFAPPLVSFFDAWRLDDGGY